MKRGTIAVLLISIIVLIIIGIGAYFIFLSSDKSPKLNKKELGLKNITEGNRREIGNLLFAYYTANGACKNWRRSNESFQDCVDVFECMAYEYSENLPEQDVLELLNVMKQEGYEKGISYYVSKNPSYAYSINFEVNECGRGRYKSYKKGAQVPI